MKDIALTAPASTPEPPARVGLPLVLLERRGFLVRSIAVGLVLGLVLVFALPARYESAARLMPPDQAGSSLLTAALSARTGDSVGEGVSALLGMKSSAALFIGILHSRSAQDELVNKFNLRHVYGKDTWEQARRRLESCSDFSEERKSGIVTIRVRDRSRERARQMCQAYIGALDRLVAEVATSAARREREFLEKRLALVKQDLDVSERDFSAFASKNTAIDIPEQAKAMVEAGATLQGQLIAAESELKGLEQTYGDENQRVRSTRARIAVLRRQLHNMAGVESDARGSGDPSLVYPSIKRLPALAVAYGDHYRRVKIQEAVYKALTTQYELARVQEAREIPTVRVLDSPSSPEKQVSPIRSLTIGGAIVICFALGVTWVLARAGWQRFDPEDPIKVFAGETRQVMSADCRKLVNVFRRGGDSNS